MREFFVAQMDFIFLFYGLAFIVLAATSYFVSRSRSDQVFWKWIALFGLVHGITEWLGMISLTVGGSAPFMVVRTTFRVLSFLCLVEVVREEAQKRWGKIFGPWVYVLLLPVTLSSGWILDGFTGVNILSCYVFGVIGGLLAARVIITSTSGRDEQDTGRTLSVFAWLLSCYVTTQFFAPKGTFLPASLINQEAFFSLLGFPVQLLRMLLATVLAGLAWKEYDRERIKKLPAKEKKNHLRAELLFLAGLVVVLFVGWIATGRIGHDKEVEEQNDRLDSARVVAAMIYPVRIKSLSGTVADFGNENYKRIQQQFLSILKDNPNVLHMYLVGQKDGKNVFLVDSDRPDKKSSFQLLEAPGEVYEEDAELLGQMFSSGGAFTVGPKTNEWGTFVSSLAAISDPVDGKFIAVVGFDYDAKDLASRIARHRLGPILITLLFTVLLMVFFVIFKREQEVRHNAQAEETKFRTLIETLPSKVFLKDRNSAYLSCNENYARDLKIKSEEIVGKTDYDFFPTNLAEKTRDEDMRIMESGETAIREEEYLGIRDYLIGAQKFYIHIVKAPVRDKAGNVTGIFGFFWDITEQKMLETEKKRVEVLASTSETKSRFASMVSHELRSPLAVIRGTLDILSEEMVGSVNGEQREILGIAKGNIDRLDRLINNVLDFQKMESGKMKFDIRENDLNEVVTEVLRSMSILSKRKGLDLRAKSEEGLSKIKFDRDKLIQVLMNLVSNAINHTEKGSITLAAKKESDAVHVSVQDTGSGISTEGVSRLFQPFEQMDGNTGKTKGGTGLGLAISKEIILAHHGKIWAESDIGKGSTFHFTLPL